MGPWRHTVNKTRTLGEVNFGLEALIDLDAHIAVFLDEQVKGIVPNSACTAEPP